MRRKWAGRPPASGTWEMWVKRTLRSFWGKDQPLAGKPGAWSIRQALDVPAPQPLPRPLSACLSLLFLGILTALPIPSLLSAPCVSDSLPVTCSGPGPVGSGPQQVRPHRTPESESVGVSSRRAQSPEPRCRGRCMGRKDCQGPLGPALPVTRRANATHREERLRMTACDSCCTEWPLGPAGAVLGSPWPLPSGDPQVEGRGVGDETSGGWMEIRRQGSGEHGRPGRRGAGGGRRGRGLCGA